MFSGHGGKGEAGKRGRSQSTRLAACWQSQEKQHGLAVAARQPPAGATLPSPSCFADTASAASRFGACCPAGGLPEFSTPPRSPPVGEEKNVKEKCA
ncbi:hypothetical protein RAN3_1031 [plant metagenome]|uniref:Uncharacterized protein n=1 Tax=plant metagenome TaxID=1297885 RepID=A0A484V110_9ZZZZ